MPQLKINWGKCIYKGVGVEKNPEEAEEWLQKAASQGHEEALLNLVRVVLFTNYGHLSKINRGVVL